MQFNKSLPATKFRQGFQDALPKESVVFLLVSEFTPFFFLIMQRNDVTFQVWITFAFFFI
jgi:hypothetical protein